MYMKIVGCGLLFISTTVLGFLKSEQLRKRVLYLNELKRMMGLLQGELRFHRATLSEAAQNVSKRVESPFSAFLNDLSGRLENGCMEGFTCVWNELSEELLRCGGFRKEDKNLFEQLGRSLGYLDLVMQTESLDLAIVQTEEAIQSAKEQREIKGKLYRTMGVTAGAFLTLLII